MERLIYLSDGKKYEYKKIRDEDLIFLNMELSKKTAPEIIDWSIQIYGEDLFYPCSFGLEGIVLIDMVSKLNGTLKIVFLDTDFHFKETYDLINNVFKRYPNLDIEILKAALTPDQQTEKYGEKLWLRNPNHCCYIRKVMPLQEKMRMHKAWLTGVRKNQSQIRAQMNYINLDQVFQRIKICPLIEWSLDDVWSYIKKNNLPFNSLHEKGYPSIGCEYCTSKGIGDTREGRWRGMEKTECGLHSNLNDLPEE